MAAADRLGAKLVHRDTDFELALGQTEFAQLRCPATGIDRTLAAFQRQYRLKVCD